MSRKALWVPFPFFFFRISLVEFKQGISWGDGVFSLSFPRILWVWHGPKILSNFEVVLDKKKQKMKERKDRAVGNLVAHVCGDPLSRYTCRNGFPQNPGVFQV